MLPILHFFVELCLLRRRPQDLPGSRALLGLVVLAALLGGMLLAITAGASVMAGLAQTALDILLLLGALHLGLKLLNRQPRFLQTATSLLGADTLIGVVALLPVGLAAPGTDAGGQLMLAGLLFLGLVVWSVLVAAHILRHALEIRLAQGAAIAVAFDILSFMLIGGLTQGTA
ncbi:hypothetical protein F2Q65_09830 [Thiohalocapsa marina]|uniref:Uncharacterized protein n=1 Tax=Thiohalocapsa marina TaxID=424902 RepID=A0A5M8FKI1_9GAMM|nr:hypothetical protein [Thiohalocapsa marina]KAA6185197.1 hypothetical protein F2Q65_09830 [Thiohalocapsa marina]